jgi:hypothetical protein
MTTNRFSDNISPESSGTGSHYTEGSFTSHRPKGLSKSLLKARWEGRHTWAKNLSNKNLATIREKLGKRVRKLSKFSKGFSYKTARQLNAEFRKEMLENPEFSRADFDDAKKIVESMRSYKTNEKISAEEPNADIAKPTRRAVHFITDEKSQESLSHVPNSLAPTALGLGISNKTARQTKTPTVALSSHAKPAPETKPDITAKREKDNLSPDKGGKIVDIDIG